MSAEPGAALAAAIRDRSLEVGIVGLGYVGLPLALGFAEAGFPVLGFDADPERIQTLERGESYIAHLDASRVRRAVASGALRATADLGRLGEPGAVLLCLPTPLTPQRTPDLSAVVETVEALARCRRPGQLVVLESTTYPGTTDEVVLPILARSGGISGRDFFLAYSPEREDPGNPAHSTTRVPKVVGGVDPLSGELAAALYGAIVPTVVPVSSARVAEAAKLTENVFRAVNIALVNELKMVYQRMGIDIWEVLDAAATKPFGFMRFNPGPGWGGHCIPVDPFYLSWKAREYGHSTHFVELAGEINVRMQEHVLGCLQKALNERGKPLRGSRVLVLGLAYKKDIADSRESPAFALLDHLSREGAIVSYHDPHVPRAPRAHRFPGLPALESVPLSAATLQASDAVLLVTDHSAVDYALVLSCAPLIVDTRGVYRGRHANVVPA